MQCEIYIDSIFLMYFILNFYMLLLVNQSTYKATGTKRLLLGAGLGAMFSCSYYLILGIPALIRGLIAFGFGGIVMMLSTFRITDTKSFFMILEKMLLFSVLLGGSTFALINRIPFLKERNQGIWVIIGLGTVGYLFYRQMQQKELDDQEGATCIAILKNGNKQVKVSALVDSGNKLIEPVSQKCVCVIEKGLFDELFDEKEELWRAIPYRSIERKNGILRGYCLKELVIMPRGIRKTFQNVYVAVANEEIGSNVRMILPACLLEE